MHDERRKRAMAAVVTLALAACGEGGGSGEVVVLLEAEDSITGGIEAGAGVENIADGWSVRFDALDVAIGGIEIHLSTDDSVRARAPDVFVVDLVQVSESGMPMWTLDGLEAARWEFFFETPAADASAIRDLSVVEAHYEAMVASGWTYFVDGVLTKPDGQSCPPSSLAEPGDAAPNGNVVDGNPCYDAETVRFTFGAAAAVRFGPCEIDGVPGFAVPDAGGATVATTIHGDHIFFNGFPEGNESGTMRLAQWLADCDLDLDGTVTAEELASIAPSDLAELDDRFQLGAPPITPLDDMLTYVRAQLESQGHFQGEGECPFIGL